MLFERDCFVVMPFGNKLTGARRRILRVFSRAVRADFDAIYDRIFAPAIESVQLPEGGTLAPQRADRTFTSGIVSEEMYQRIEYSRVVLADITGLNANVFLELGHRYRARSTGTVVVRQTAAVPSIPFDINQIRAFPYEYEPEEQIAVSRDLIARVLRESLAHNHLDSPVQQALRHQWERHGALDMFLRTAEQAIAAGDPARAISVLRLASQEDRQNPLLLVRLGVLYKEQNDFLAVIDCMKRAIALDMQYADAHRELGVAQNQLFRRGRSAESGVDALRQATQLNPDDYDAWSSLGGALKRIGDEVGALAAYERATVLSRGNSYPLLNALVLRASVKETLMLDELETEQLRRADRSLVAQASRKPPYNPPWSAFDLALTRFMLGDDAGFTQWTEEGAAAATATYMLDTYVDTLERLEPLAPGRPIRAALQKLVHQRRVIEVTEK